MSNYELNKLNKLISAVTTDLQECKDAVSNTDKLIDVDDIMQDNSFYIKEVMRRVEILQSQHPFLNDSDALRLNHLIRVVNHILRNIEV